MYFIYTHTHTHTYIYIYIYIYIYLYIYHVQMIYLGDFRHLSDKMPFKYYQLYQIIKFLIGGISSCELHFKWHVYQEL